MSIFQGKLQEYPFIAIDNFTAETLDCDVFFLSHCHSDHMEGLSSKEFHEKLKSNSEVHLYCSETTNNLLKFDANLKHLCHFTRDIPVSQPTLIQLKDEMGELKSIVVTLIPAGHCVGSVMFLFEGDQGTVLYTGDFRLQKGDIKKVSCLKSGDSVKIIQGLYIDTTFCMPLLKTIPQREESKDAMVRLMSGWLEKGSNYAVFIQCKTKYGFEYLYKEIAKTFKMKIHLDDYKYNLYSAVSNMSKYFTTDKLSTQIHSCRWNAKGCFSENIPCGVSTLNGKPVKVMTIKPSILWFAMENFIPDDHTSYVKKQDLYRVVHSMHSSYEEIRDVVAYLRPKYLYPTVNPINADVIGAYNSLKDLLRYDNMQESNATAEASNTELKINTSSTDNVAKAQWELGLQTEAVMSPDREQACFDDLGINVDVNSPPMPSLKRKLKKRKQIDENEKKLDGSVHGVGSHVVLNQSQVIDNKNGKMVDFLSEKEREESFTGTRRNFGVGHDPCSSFRTVMESREDVVDSSSQVLKNENFSEKRACLDSKNKFDSCFSNVVVCGGKDNGEYLERVSKTTFDKNVLHHEFDIPVSPGFEGPTEEQLHKLYAQLSKGEVERTGQ